MIINDELHVYSFNEKVEIVIYTKLIRRIDYGV
jgi:hypothetical protein